MLHIILFEPEIPPNTGNIIRLAANTGCQLHIIKPMAFEFDDKRLRRAGLDYHEWANVQFYDSFAECCDNPAIERVFALTTKATCSYSETSYQAGDALMFGPESRGLPANIRDSLPEQQRLRIPMLPDSRSLNLSNSVAVVVFEAWRQLGFEGGA
ncbi:tRNA (cytosine34-2'-O-)-methyltransferase [gamma proteobacterium IMCC2047]|nr:tRNA (cytosine34-2'-O-)-methyltransferase [gamma proteobacterium IMCC2047]